MIRKQPFDILEKLVGGMGWDTEILFGLTFASNEICFSVQTLILTSEHNLFQHFVLQMIHFHSVFGKTFVSYQAGYVLFKMKR